MVLVTVTLIAGGVRLTNLVAVVVTVLFDVTVLVTVALGRLIVTRLVTTWGSLIMEVVEKIVEKTVTVCGRLMVIVTVETEPDDGSVAVFEAN